MAIEQTDDIEWRRPPVGEMPSEAGAYILEFDADRPLKVEVGALGVVSLPAGRLRYYGSARGPGGLSARLKRHLRAEGATHWHVDYIAEELEIRRVGFTTVLGECELVALDTERSAWRAPVPGFGASDCGECPAHLLAHT